MIRQSFFIRLILLVIFSKCFLTNYVYASGCNGYPFSDGLQVSSVDGGNKFISTSKVAMLFDDIDEELQAKKEASIIAKSQIVKFLNENISSDEQIDKNVSSQVNTDGQDLTKAKQIVKIIASSYKNDASAVLKGLIQIGDCTNPGEFVKVTFGLKPSTISSAEETSRALSESINSEVSSSDQKTISSQSENKSNNGIAKSTASQNAQTDF